MGLFVAGIRKTAYRVVAGTGAFRAIRRYGYALDVDAKRIILTMGMPGAIHRHSFRAHRMSLACALLALIPMTGALAGVAFDEYRHLGFSNWLSACRAAGTSPGSLVVFTLELLPSAVVGLLAGGLVVQSLGILLRRRGYAPNTALAAHGGCGLGMTAGLLLCTLAPPSAWMVAVEALLAALAAAWLFTRSRRHAVGKSVVLPTGRETNAQ